MRWVGKATRGVLIAVALTGCDSTQPLFGARRVDVVEARTRSVPELLDYPARIEAPAHVEVKARTEGYLLERSFDDGTDVLQNRVMFVLQADEYETALEKAKADLEAAQAALGQATLRVRALEARGGEPKALEAARYGREAAAAAVRARQAAVESAELKLSYTTLRAPIDGRIEPHPIDVGNLVRPGDLLATIVQLDPIYASFDVGVEEAAALQEADRQAPILTMVVGDDGVVHDRLGRVRSIGGAVQGTTGKIPVQAVVPNPRNDLLAGQNAHVRLLLRWYVDGVVIPERAVHGAGDKMFVFVVGDEDVVEHRSVRAGPRHGGERVVLEGLESGERVVVGRTTAAIPGRRVHAVPAELPPQPTPRLAPRVAPPAIATKPAEAPEA